MGWAADWPMKHYRQIKLNALFYIALTQAKECLMDQVGGKHKNTQATKHAGDKFIKF